MGFSVFLLYVNIIIKKSLKRKNKDNLFYGVWNESSTVFVQTIFKNIRSFWRAVHNMSYHLNKLILSNFAFQTKAL